ncbi:MAG: hypothetical protein WD378_09185, partial [Egicoccus sp.]
MPIDERRRIALRSQIATTWGEEAAQTLFELLTPAGQEMATRTDLEAGFAAMDGRFSAVDARFAVLEERLDGMEERFKEHVSSEFNRLDANSERRINQAITMQTRTLVWSQLGALVTVAALAFGL